MTPATIYTYPGAPPVCVTITVENTGAEVFGWGAVRLEGLPATWWHMLPDTGFLSPHGALFPYDRGEFAIEIHPPHGAIQLPRGAWAVEYPYAVILENPLAPSDPVRAVGRVIMGILGGPGTPPDGYVAPE